MCCFADPDRHNQACALCRLLLWTGLLFPSSVNRRTFRPLHLDLKTDTHTRAHQSVIGNDCACAKDAPSLNRHNCNQKVAALKPVSVCWVKLYWFELKMPFRATAQQASQKQTGRDIATVTVLTHRPAMSTSLWTQVGFWRLCDEKPKANYSFKPIKIRSNSVVERTRQHQRGNEFRLNKYDMKSTHARMKLYTTCWDFILKGSSYIRIT